MQAQQRLFDGRFSMTLGLRSRFLFALLAALLVAGSVSAAPFLVRDLNPGTEVFPGLLAFWDDHAGAGQPLYFLGSDPAHGLELWRTDGTAAGTWRVTDVCAGPCDARPLWIEVFQGQVYFSADDGISGRELWASTGAPGDARLVRDLCPGPCSGDPVEMKAAGGHLFFDAFDGTGRQLWATGGSRGTTVPLRRLCAGALQCIQYRGIEALGDLVLFTVSGESYQQLWRSDGTVAGTGPLADFVPGGVPVAAEPIARLGSLIYFWAEDGLWQTDGTAAGTRRIATDDEVGLSVDRLDTRTVATWQGMLFWVIDGHLLVRSDGTREGTLLLLDFPSGAFARVFTPLPQTLVFGLDWPEQGSLWRTDGTPETTRTIASLPGSVEYMAPVGDRALIRVLLPNGNVETQLWTTDGTSEGTDLVDVPSPGDYVGFASVGDQAVYFDGGVLVRSDGTEAGTVALHDFGTVPASGGPLAQTELGGGLLFSARTSAAEAPLFVSDGSAAGTRVLSTEASWVRRFGRAGNRAFFEAFDQELDPYGNGTFQPLGLWTTDGDDVRQIGPGIRIFGNPSAVGRNLFFSAARGFSLYGHPDLELYRSNGTAAGTGLVKNINNTAADTQLHHTCYNAPSSPGPGVDLGGRLLFAADNGIAGRELFLSDGSAVGTKLVKDINPRLLDEPPAPDCSSATHTPVGSDPQDLVRFRSGALFTADDGKTGRELWWTDGTSKGTRRVADLRRGAQGSAPHDLVAFRNRIWFVASAQGVGEGLWRTDGTAQGTVLVHPLRLRGLPSWARSLTVAGDRLFFAVFNESTGAELWASEGTAATTRLVADVRPGSTGSSPQHLTAAGDLLVFAADDGTHGLEPWQSDGTAAGTVQLGDIHPGLDASSPGPFTPIAGGLVLTGADDGEHGRELWALPVEEIP
jgi:ELWxxDGT repeat protein